MVEVPDTRIDELSTVDANHKFVFASDFRNDVPEMLKLKALTAPTTLTPAIPAVTTLPPTIVTPHVVSVLCAVRTAEVEPEETAAAEAYSVIALAAPPMYTVCALPIKVLLTTDMITFVAVPAILMAWAEAVEAP